MNLYAMKRAALLMCEIAGAQISSSVTDIYPEEIKPCKVTLSLSRMTNLIGSEIPKDRVLSILEALDIRVSVDNGDALELLIPTYRTDVTREADVVEEVLRIYGFNAIPLPKN
jgi:phenylalanyl-tRNA synthetase beta chain